MICFQVDELVKKYDQLEVELVTERNKTKDSILEFIENIAMVKQIDFLAEFEKLKARTRDSHEVSV